MSDLWSECVTLLERLQSLSLSMQVGCGPSSLQPFIVDDDDRRSEAVAAAAALWCTSVQSPNIICRKRWRRPLLYISTIYSYVLFSYEQSVALVPGNGRPNEQNGPLFIFAYCCLCKFLISLRCDTKIFLTLSLHCRRSRHASSIVVLLRGRVRFSD